MSIINKFIRLDDGGAGHRPWGAYTGRRGRHWAGLHGETKSLPELSRLRSALLQRTRGAREPCVVPDKVLYRIDAGTEGAMVVSFSHSGHILASELLHTTNCFCSDWSLSASLFPTSPYLTSPHLT
jgi:hypothetical protein